MEEYPRWVTPGFKPFHPLELAKRTGEIVTRFEGGGCKRKYTDFYATGVYGGIATGYTVGCCLRCVFCWVDLSREFPDRFGKFYSPREAFNELAKAAKKYHTKKLRISGAEPTLGKAHLLGLLDEFESSNYDLFILETNGILFSEEEYAKAIAGYDRVHIRVSLKAGDPKNFQRKTGAKESSFDLPFKAIKNLLRFKARFHVAAMSADPRIMDTEERASLVRKLWEINPLLVKNLEEEVIDPYETTLLRLKKAGLELEWPLRRIYKPIREELK
jgi:uncharacterized Fe-S cluster-containing radical SAM superfamily protein